MKRAVQGLIDAGDMEEVGKNTMHGKFTYKGRTFMLASPEKVAAAMN